MKTFKLIGLTIVMVFFAMGLYSCGSDDETDSPTPTTPATPTFKHSVYGEYGGTRYFMYPCFDWGCSKSKVKDFMKGYSVSKEETDQIIYGGKYRETITAYIFENGILKGAGISISSKMITVETIVSLLQKDYTYVGEEDDAFYLISKDEKSALVMTVSKSADIQLVWVKITSSSKAKTSRSNEGLQIDIQKANEIKAELFN
ncbi:MAG: hypothetical protein MJZ32_00885 [Bacteroidaceae bacterium]|nr:hypothetical protein [Bacteroidaceae bacterium]